MYEFYFGNFGRQSVDLCFVRELDGSDAIASFELKIIAKDADPAWKTKVRVDIVKHFDSAKDLGSAERHNCLFVITKDDLPKEDIESAVKECARGLLSDPVFFTSDSIQLNHVIPNAPLRSYLRVIVFTGTSTGAASGNKG